PHTASAPRAANRRNLEFLLDPRIRAATSKQTTLRAPFRTQSPLTPPDVLARSRALSPAQAIARAMRSGKAEPISRHMSALLQSAQPPLRMTLNLPPILGAA